MKNILKLFAILSCIFLALAPTPKSGKSSGSKAALEWTELELQGSPFKEVYWKSTRCSDWKSLYPSSKLQPHQILGVF